MSEYKVGCDYASAGSRDYSVRSICRDHGRYRLLANHYPGYAHDEGDTTYEVFSLDSGKVILSFMVKEDGERLLLA